MPSDFQLEYPVLQMRWTIDLEPERFLFTDLRSIGTFTFQYVEWLLTYSLRWYDKRDSGMINYPRFQPHAHRLCLHKNSCGPHPPFDVTVHVEAGDGTERIVLEGLSCKQRIGPDEIFASSRRTLMSTDTIWTQSDIDVKRIHPDFESNRQLIFLIELKKDNEKDSATQTNCSIPASYDLNCMDNLSEDFARLKVRGSDTDVEFLCEGRTYKAHGTVVCARSPVFACMLSSDMIEGRTRVIQIPDMTPEVLQIFLWYLYTGKTPELTFELAWTLYESADQYAVLGLARRCSRYLVEQLSDENVWDVLVLADAHCDEGFVEEVIDSMVDRNTLKASDRWPSFCEEHPVLANKVHVLNPF